MTKYDPNHDGQTFVTFKRSPITSDSEDWAYDFGGNTTKPISIILNNQFYICLLLMDYNLRII